MKSVIPVGAQRSGSARIVRLIRFQQLAPCASPRTIRLPEAGGSELRNPLGRC